MNIQKVIGLFMTVGFLFTATATGVQAADSDYSFKVHNGTNSTIKKLLVSEDGKQWGDFDIGNGIAAGDADTLVWDSSTDHEGCEQWVKAVFADGSEAQAAKFDFCDKSLEIEF